MRRREFLGTAAALLIAGCATTAIDNPFRSDRFSVTTSGSGPDVVLIPGLTSSRDIWNGTVAAVPGYRYHLVQLAGFAGAPVAGNAAGPVLEPVSEEIARYIREAGLRRPALIGHSMGGSLAMMTATRHPGLVGKVMVVDMVPFLGAMFGPYGTTPASVRPVAEQMRDRLAAADAGARRSAIQASIATMVKTEALRADPIAHGLASDQGLGARSLHDLMITDLRPELPAITVPLTVLYVRAPNSPLDDAQIDAFYRQAYATAPMVRLKRITDAWHFIMFDQPGVFHDEVRVFLGSA